MYSAWMFSRERSGRSGLEPWRSTHRRTRRHIQCVRAAAPLHSSHKTLVNAMKGIRLRIWVDLRASRLKRRLWERTPEPACASGRKRRVHPQPPAPARIFAWIVLRLPPALFGLFCTCLGLAARALFKGPDYFYLWKYIGVLLWCWVVHACVRCVNPRLSVAAAAWWAVGISWGVELLQITDLPRRLSSKHWFLRQVFGEVFNPFDLVAATASILLVIPVDRAIRRWSAHSVKASNANVASQCSPM